MAQSDKNLVSLTAAEHIGPTETGDNIDAKRAANYVWNSSTQLWERQTPIDVSGLTVDTTPTFKEDPSDTGEDPKYGKVDIDGDVQVDVLSSALPSGAATEATLAGIKTGTDKIPVSPATSGKQDTGNTSLSSIDGKITAVNTGAVVVSSSALPTGAATSAKQDTGNTSLGSIDTKLTDVATQTTLALIKAKTDNIDVALSTRTKPADAQHVIVDSGVTTGLTDTQLRASAVPVTANAGTNLNTSALALDTTIGTTNTEIGGLTETAPATDTASSGLNGRLQRIAQRLTSIIALLPGSLGQKARAASLAVTLSSEDITALTPTTGLTDTQLRATPVPVSGTVAISNPTTNPETGLAKDVTLGSLTETAPATDTASSGLNGRLQRIAQRLTSIIALLPGSLGQKARAASLAVALSTEDVTALTPPAAITGYATSANQTTELSSLSSIDSKLTSPLTAKKNAGTSTTSANVSTSTSVATLVASNASRIKATVYNDSTTGVLYVKEGAAASATSFDYALAPASATSPGGLLICDDYTGILTGILSTGTGTARCGET